MLLYAPYERSFLPAPDRQAMIEFAPFWTAEKFTNINRFRST